MSDEIRRPDHYTAGGYETWDFTNALHLGPEAFNVVKYLSRAGLKTEDGVKDIRKAIEYLDRMDALREQRAKEIQPFVNAKGLGSLEANILYALLTGNHKDARAMLLYRLDQEKGKAIRSLAQADAERDAASERADGSEPEPG